MRFTWVPVVGVLLVVSCILAGCGAPIDTSAISSYASVTASSATAFEAVASDFGASCERYRSVVSGLLETSSTAQQPPALLSEAPGLDAFLLPDASPAPGYLYTPPAAPLVAGTSSAPLLVSGDSSCDDARSVSTAWSQANATVLKYVQALGNLAGVDAAPTGSPAPLATGLTKAGVTASAVQGVSTLVTTIVSYFETHRRDLAIADFLHSVNDALPVAIDALEVTDAAYTLELDNEFRKTTSQYGTFVRAEALARDALPSGDIDRRDAFNRRLAQTKGSVETALSAIDDHLRASRAYGAAIAGILATHRDLYKKSRTKASLADYVTIIQTTGAPVFTSLQALAKAVK
jgi:hypothetical protein